MRKTLWHLALGMALAQAGCTLAPPYARPPAPVPSGWPGGPSAAGATVPTRAPAGADLAWQAFAADPNLREIIALALANNRDLRLAALRADQAQAIYGIRRADLLPAVNMAAGGNKTRIPGDLSSSGSPKTSERYDVNWGIASWELDFFGRIRSLKDRALREYLATEQARRAAQVVLVSAVANACLTLAADNENLRLATTTLETQQQACDLVRRNVSLGLAPEIDLNRAQTQVESARVDEARFRQLVAQDGNTLAFLAGGPVPERLLPADLDGIAPFAEVAAGLSSDVLLRRPDVLQAEELLQASYADLGAARAAFFPRISLTAALGTASSDLTGLFKSGSEAWSFTPQLAMPIFDARIWSANEAAKVQREIAVTQYEKAIQAAFRETADALAARVYTVEELSAQQALVDAVDRTYRLSTVRYTQGIDSYLGVLDAQRSLVAARQGLVYLRLAERLSRVRLYSALGGGG